jgi:uncharacterized protein YjhX (UPF0386 family)
VLKRINDYRKALKKLRNESLIQLVRGSGPYKITEDGIRVARLIMELQQKGML